MTSFPDPNVYPEFTGENGITYSWDATDGKWVIKGFSTPAAAADTPFVARYRVVHPDDYTGESGTASVKTPSYSVDDKEQNWQASGITEINFATYDLDGNPFGDKEVSQEGDSLRTFDIEPAEHDPDDSNSYKYVGYNAIEQFDRFGYKVENISYGYNKYSEGQIIYVRGPSRDVLAKTTYVDYHVEDLQLQIDELEQEVDLIAPRLDGAQYKYVDTPAVKPGEMHIVSGTFTAPTDLVLLNDQALDGVTHGWGDLHVHDYLEITDTQNQLRTAQNYAMYMVTKEPEGAGLKQIEVALVKGSGTPAVDDVLDVKGFQLGGNEINDLDDRYMRKDAYNTRLYKQEYVNNFDNKDWKTYSPAPGTFELAVNGSYSWETNQSLAFRDLYDKFPPDEWMFVPGFVTALEMNSWSGFQYAPRWQMRMDNIPRFDAEGQVLRGWWRGSNPTNTAGKMYLRFECFRRK